MRFIELYESSSYLLLETPQRLAWLVKNRGPNLVAKYEAEKTHGIVHSDTSRHIELMDGETTEEKLIKFIMSFDPTGAKNYSNWLCSRYMAKPEKGGCQLEDFNASVTADLAMFERVSRSRRIENGNLDAYKSLQDLQDVIEPFREGDREVSNRADRAAGRSTGAAVMFPASDPMRTPQNVDVLLDDPDLLILQLKNETAARHFGENTNWCTTSGMFNNYNETSPLYILCDRKKNSRTQWHFNGSNSQFMNEKDRAIPLNAYLREHPKAFKVFHQQFLALLGVSVYGGESVDASLFTPEDLAEAPVQTLARLVKKPSDIDKLPRLLTEEGFKYMILRRPFAKHDHYAVKKNGAPFEKEQFAKVLAKFFKALKPAFFIDFVMGERAFVDGNTWIWDYLPEKWKTEKVKNSLCDQIVQNNSNSSVTHQINIYFGEEESGWTEHIYEAYFDAAAGAGWDAENFKPKDFTDARMVKVLAANPADIAKHLDRLNPKIVGQIVRLAQPYDIQEVFENLPPEYRNKEAAKALHTSANQFKAKRDQHQRDLYLNALTHFDPEHWGVKAHRIAQLSKNDFSKLPERFQTKEFAAQICMEQPNALERIPAAFVDQKVVNASMLHGEWPWVLENTDPHVITPEMVFEGAKNAINENIKERKEALKLPKHYKTYRPMLEYLIDHATLPLNDPDWPTDLMTPDLILKKIRLTTRGDRPKAYVNYGYSSRSHGSTHETKKRQSEWDDRFESAWRQVPASAKTPEVVAAIVKSLPYTVSSLALNEADQKLLTNDVMNIFFEATKGDTGADSKEAFKAFPESAWSQQILAQAIKRGYIDKVPDAFKETADPATVIQMIASDRHYKEVDWSVVTPDMLTTAISKGGYTSIVTRVPVDSPLLDDEAVVFAALKHAVDDERGFGARHYKKDLAKLWPPERRGHWQQRDWDLAGGAIIPLEEVPAKFRHEDLAVKSVLRDPANLQHIPNPIEWLNENSEQISTARGFKLDSWIKQGIYFDGKRWIDDTKEPHTKVASGGSYSYAKTQTGARVAFIYGKDGKLINGLAAKLGSGESYSNQRYQFTSEWDDGSYGRNADDALAALQPYRDVIEAVFAKHEDIEESFTSGWTDKMSRLRFYKNPKNGDRLTMVEKLPRTNVGDRSDNPSHLTYVRPSTSYNDNAFVIYDGEGPSAPEVARIKIDTTHGGGNKFEASKVNGTGADFIRHSKALKDFLYGPGDLASGTGPKFKDSDLYRKCGIRGTGGFEWFSLFDEKIMEHGGMSIWRCGKVISIADDEHGLVATGKKAKDGTFTLGETFADVDEDKLHKIFSMMAGKL